MKRRSFLGLIGAAALVRTIPKLDITAVAESEVDDIVLAMRAATVDKEEYVLSWYSKQGNGKWLSHKQRFIANGGPVLLCARPDANGVAYITDAILQKDYTSSPYIPTQGSKLVHTSPHNLLLNSEEADPEYIIKHGTIVHET